MMSVILEFIHYKNWANKQVLATCQALTAEQLNAGAPGAFPTVRDTLEHHTNITTILNQLGLTPPEVDGWSYLMSNIDPPGA